MPRKRSSGKRRVQSQTRSLTGSYQQPKSKRSTKTSPVSVVKRSEAGQVADFFDYQTQQSEIHYDVEQVLPQQSKLAVAGAFQNIALVTTLTGIFSAFPKK